MKNTKGFTLVELVIVIVIVGILSIVAVPIYTGYLRKAMATEAKSLLGSIQTAQKVYFAEHNNFFSSSGSQTQNSVLDLDARTNKYFTSYSVTGNENGFTAITSGTGDASPITITLVAPINGKPTWIDSGVSNN